MSTVTISTKAIPFPTLVDTREAAKILGRSVATLKRWRYEGTGPNWIELQGRVSYDVSVLLEFIRGHAT
jgi:predicted site-specific integrase-resolvase